MDRIKYLINVSAERDLATIHALLQVEEFLGLKLATGPEQARFIVTDSPIRSLTELKAGNTVVELVFELEADDNAGAGLIAFYKSRYWRVRSVPSLLSTLASIVNNLPAVQPLVVAPEVKASDCAAVCEASVLVVDDSPINRAVAQVQFATARELIVTASYMEALKLLRSSNHMFSIVLTDLIMPAEADLLGPSAQHQIGIPIAAGLFIALQATAKHVSDILVVTHGSHHDSPMVAALTQLPEEVQAEDCFYSFHNVSTLPCGGKDWLAAYAKHLKLHGISD